jgi:hypothetical protein
MTLSRLLPIGLAIIALPVLVLIGKGIAASPPEYAIIVAVGLLIAVLSFFRMSVGIYILIISMLLSPEFTVAQTSAREITVRGDDLLLLILGFTWLVQLAIRRNVAVLKSSPLNAPILAYIGVCLLSTSLGVFRGKVSTLAGFFFVLKFIEYFVIYFIVLNVVPNTREQVEKFTTAIFITSALASLWGIWQIVSGDVERVSAPFEGAHGEPGTFGGYLVLIFALVLSFFIFWDGPRYQVIFGMLALIILPPLLKTLSRASYMAFLPMFVVLMFFSKRRGILTMFLAISMVSAPLVSQHLGEIGERIEYTFESGELDPSSKERVESYRTILTRFWPEYPFLGAGITGRGFIDGQYFRILAETGALGLLCFVWLLVRIYRMTLRTYRESTHRFDQAISLGFLAGFVGMLFHALTANTFIIVRIMEPFWCIVGIVAVLHNLLEQEQAEASVKEKLMPNPVIGQMNK